MCELNDNHGQNSTSDVIYNGFPVAICSECITAIMIHNDPQDTLIDFATSWPYKVSMNTV